MTQVNPFTRPPPARPFLGFMVTLAAMLSFLSVSGCSGDPPPSCGAPGLARPCPCAGGGEGVQECGPWGAWTACVCGAGDAGGDGGGDGSRDRPAGDAVAVADAADAGEDRPEASADAADAVAVADAADSVAVADVLDDSPPDSPPPAPSIDLTLSVTEVWQSIDGAPPRLVGTSCGVTASQVSYRAPAMRGSYNLNTRASSTSAGCDGMAGDFRPPDVTHMARGPYGPPGSVGMQRVNLHIRGSLGPPLCERTTRIEVWALGCAVAP